MIFNRNWELQKHPATWRTNQHWKSRCDKSETIAVEYLVMCRLRLLDLQLGTKWFKGCHSYDQFCQARTLSMLQIFSMERCVFSKRFRVRACKIALWTLVWLFSSVNAEVSFQMYCLVERASALFTVMWLFSTVGEDMLVKFWFCDWRVVAPFALIWSF